jgi:hypothetical protein
LNDLGVPTQFVKLIVATHWHDDHIRGLGTLLERCNEAAFACTTAMGDRQFIELATTANRMEKKMTVKSGVSEFYKVLRLLEKRRREGHPQAEPKWASAGKNLLQSADSLGIPFRVEALSPSDRKVREALQHIAALLPEPGFPKLRVPPPRPNHSSVVLWIDIGPLCVLLGADLEENNCNGWTEILDSAVLPHGRPGLFKVPHHGSKNGHCDRVWSDLLDANPNAILTPFLSGGVSLPEADDCKRISQLTKYAFISQSPGVSRPIPRSRTPSYLGSYRVVARAKVPGHVRLRANLIESVNPTWNVRFFGGALNVSEIEI